MSVSPATAAPARAALLYRVNPYRKTALPSRYALHLMNRMGCGFSSATWRHVRRSGGPHAWFELQLRPGKITESRKARQLREWFLARPGALRRPADRGHAAPGGSSRRTTSAEVDHRLEHLPPRVHPPQHTVGRTSGYTEEMVRDSAVILSGWTVDAFGTWRAALRPHQAHHRRSTRARLP